MEQMEQLFAFMQEDMKVDRISNEIRRSPIRQQAEKARETYFNQQDALKQLEEQVATLSDRKDAIRDAVSRCREQLSSLESRMAEHMPETLEEAQKLLADCEKIRRNIANYEGESKQIGKKSQDATGRINKIVTTMATAKQDFERFKAEYAVEAEKRKAELESARAVAAEAKGGIAENLMKEYEEVKKHIIPPMARLNAGACSGCNTSQPSAMLRRIESGKEIVECETCGRILFM